MVATLVVAGCDRGSQTPEGGELAETPSPWPDDDATSAAVAPRGDMASPGPSTPSKAATPGGDADQAAARKVPEAGEPPPLEGLYSDDELEVARTMADYWMWLIRHPNTDPELVKKIFGRPKEGKPPTKHAREILEKYKKHQWWWTGGKPEVVDIEVLDQQAPNVRVVRIYYRRRESMKLIDSNENVHSERPPNRTWWEEVWSREDADSAWKTISVMEKGHWRQRDL